jgi:hypothetical protein
MSSDGSSVEEVSVTYATPLPHAEADCPGLRHGAAQPCAVCHCAPCGVPVAACRDRPAHALVGAVSGMRLDVGGEPEVPAAGAAPRLVAVKKEPVVKEEPAEAAIVKDEVGSAEETGEADAGPEERVLARLERLEAAVVSRLDALDAKVDAILLKLVGGAGLGGASGL